MIYLKEEFLTCDKVARAIKLGGYEALGMWLALKLYCSLHLTDGFIPDEDVDALAAAPPNGRRALKALVNCGRVKPDGGRGFGLVDAVEHGWQLHDYLEHAYSREQEQKKRIAAKKRKDRWLERHAEHDENAKRNGVPYAVRNAFGTEPSPPLSSPLLLSSLVGPPKDQNRSPDLTGGGVGEPAAPMPPAPRKRGRAADVPGAMFETWEPPEGVVATQATRWQATREQLLRTVPEFRNYWIDDGARKSAAGWTRAWTNRLAALAKRSELWVEDLRKLNPRNAIAPGLDEHQKRLAEQRLEASRARSRATQEMLDKL